MKMIKSAVLAVSVLASAGVFAGSAALNVGANAQVESNGGLLGRVGSGVGNIVGTTLHTTRDIATTATGASLGVAGQAVHASRDIAVNATDRAFGVADRVTDRGERGVEQARYEEQRQREQARQYRAEQKHVQIHAGRIRKRALKRWCKSQYTSGCSCRIDQCQCRCRCQCIPT